MSKVIKLRPLRAVSTKPRPKVKATVIKLRLQQIVGLDGPTGPEAA